MANQDRRRPENAAGDFYVDASCIDCDTCRWMAPETFTQAGDQAAVHHQPAPGTERRQALEALVSCPTASIGTVERHDLCPVLDGFPLPVAENVYHCGYHSESSFGAASYLIRRPEGNVLVDSPRFARQLVRRLEELGGVRTLFLTHRDDVADHERYHEHFGCERILHAADATGSLRSLERLVEGEDALRLAHDLVIVPVPGHTRGSASLLHRERFLFTGDHLAWSAGLGHLYAFRSACWYDWRVQSASMRRLRGIPFEWVLPGHGRRCHLPVEEMQAQLERTIAWMEARD